MKTLALALIAGIALSVASLAGAEVKKTIGNFNTAFDGQTVNR